MKSDVEWRDVLEDERLVLLAQDGDHHAQEILVYRYMPLVRSRVRNYFIPGGDRDDLFQEGLLGLIKAVRDFRPGQGSRFRYFAELCIGRQVITAVKTATRQKHAALNYYRSLDVPCSSDGEGRSLAEKLPAGDSVEDVVAHDLESHLQVLARAREFLTAHEFSVLQLYLEGFSYQEIALRLGRGIKSVDNAVFKVKLKLRRRSTQIVA